MGATFPGQSGTAQASQHQGFVGTARFVTPGQVQVTQPHRGPPGAGATGPAGLAQTLQQKGMQGTQRGPMSGTTAMTTTGTGVQAAIRQTRQPKNKGAGAGGQGTPAVARPPRTGYSGIGMYLAKLGPFIVDQGTVLVTMAKGCQRGCSTH
jgi:hypothetical protein